jgi:anti-sigma B factor antagonist
MVPGKPGTFGQACASSIILRRHVMELKVVKEDSQLVYVALAGKLDVQGEEAIGDRFRELVETRRASFIIDMSQVTYLASLGIRLLFAAAKSLAASGNKLVVLKPQPMVEETLLSSGTAKLVPIAADEEAARSLL